VTLTNPGRSITPRAFQVFDAKERMIASKEIPEKIKGEFAVNLRLDEMMYACLPLDPSNMFTA
jgi:hypothetical protein